MNERQSGYIHLYVGSGKGKTTAAMGLALRALGSARRVLVAQFLKGRGSGELAGLRTLGAVLLDGHFSPKFTFQMDDAEKAETRAACARLLETVAAETAKGACLVVLDEVVDAVNAGMLAEDALCAWLDARPDGCEVVLTGRNPPAAIEERADYLTEMTARRHPYQKGVAARQGIEY